MTDLALRFDNDKVKHELVSPNAINELAKVLTFGAAKYAPNNWQKGMKWSRVIGSLKRHLNAIERGEDHDPETGLLHSAHVMCNAMFLTDYYKIYPEGDDRMHTILPDKKIGLDIDEVLADWTKAWGEKFGYEIPANWNFSYDNHDHFKSFTDEELNAFYLAIPRKIDPKDLNFEPHCYITSRSVPVELTKKWIQTNGFPTAPVISLGFGQSKVAAALESGIDYFVDDNYTNYVELNAAGVCTFLFDAPHNQKYNVGYKRIYDLKDLKK
jgi:5'(3')-deoxyribonucleotidase